MNSPVEIHGRKVGSQLTCAQVMQMKPVSLEKRFVEQVENSREMVADGKSKSGKASDPNESEEIQSRHMYDDFLSYNFKNVLGLVKTTHSEAHLCQLINLLLFFLTEIGIEATAKLHAGALVSELTKKIALLLGPKTNSLSTTRNTSVLITLFRALHLLMVPDRMEGLTIKDDLIPKNATSKTSVVYCDDHNIPAVRRRSPRGAFKDRRFYVCGLERGKRCKFFKWADEVDAAAIDKQPSQVRFCKIVRECLWKTVEGSDSTLESRLCEVFEESFLFEEDGNAMDSSGKTNDLPIGGGQRMIQGHHHSRDFADGVFCSREKLYGIHPKPQRKELKPFDRNILFLNSSGKQQYLQDDVKILEACLDVISLVADYRTEGIHKWFAFLCEVEVSSTSLQAKEIAKKSIQALCGKKLDLFQSVRHHFSFGIKCRKLFTSLGSTLQEASWVSQKASVCCEKAIGKELGLWDFIGSNDLISEDEQPIQLYRSFEQQIDELWTMAKGAGSSWRHYCSLQTQYQRRESATKSAFVDHLIASPPLNVVFMAAFSLNGKAQHKLLRLINLALAQPQESRTDRSVKSEIDRILRDATKSDSGCSLQYPETIVLQGLAIDNLAKFVVRFVLEGETLDLRRVSLHIASKLTQYLQKAQQVELLGVLLSTKFLELGSYGKGSVEYLTLLRQLGKALPSTSEASFCADLVLECFMDQMATITSARANVDWTLKGGTTTLTRRHLDPLSCMYCMTTVAENIPSGMSDKNRSKRSSESKARDEESRKKVHPDQVSPFFRSRLENLKHSMASNEFCSFVSLKQRLVVSEIQVHITDQRGRFVKCLTVSCSPRPTASAQDLKAAAFDGLWQECAKIEIPRGASLATCKVSIPFVAANIRIEYTDFYERPNGSKSSDGSFLVHCPRCTRGMYQIIRKYDGLLLYSNVWFHSRVECTWGVRKLRRSCLPMPEVQTHKLRSP